MIVTDAASRTATDGLLSARGPHGPAALLVCSAVTQHPLHPGTGLADRMLPGCGPLPLGADGRLPLFIRYKLQKTLNFLSSVARETVFHPLEQERETEAPVVT